MSTPTKELSTAYSTLQSACGIAKGDKVKVLRKAKDYEMGWGTVWNDDMDRAIGKTLTVTAIHSYYGMRLEIPDDNEYYFPFFILEVKKPAIKEAELSISGLGVTFNAKGARILGGTLAHKDVQAFCENLKYLHEMYVEKYKISV
jgi:hypothetical protein